MIKKIINKKFDKFFYYYSYLGNRIIIGVILSFIVGLLDGFGLAFFLPLLTMFGGENGKSTGNADAMGNFSFLGDGVENLGVDVTVNRILIIIFIIFIIKGLVKWVEGIYSVNTQRLFITSIRKESIRLFKNYKYSAYTRTDSGKLQNIFTGVVSGVSAGYKAFFSSIQNGIMVLVYVTMAFISNFYFAFMVLIGAVLINFIFQWLYKKTKQISREVTRIAHDFSGILIQYVAFFKYLKSTGRTNAYGEKIEKIIDEAEVYNRKMGVVNALLTAIREPIIVGLIILMIYWQVAVLGNSIVSVLLSVMLLFRALSALLVIQTSWNTFLQSTGSLESMRGFTEELTHQAELFGTQKFNTLREELQLKNVSFNYEGGDTIINNLNIAVPKNQMIAFVGESGSGKTTAVNLLAGLFKPVSGEYLIDSVNTVELDIRQFQSRIGYITQEPIIFDDNVFNNVTFWDEKTPENLVKFWEALRKAAVDNFVKELKNKEDTRLGNNGIMISGGQKQRISIARELYRDIDVLIMDEATSALDSETEKAIQENIDSLKGKYTIIIVAHRLSTIKNVDKIVLMKKGEIAGVGSFEELQGLSTDFKKMVSLQEL